MRMKTVRVRYVREWMKWIFDSNRKLVYEMVPIGPYRFLLRVRTVGTEVMSCQPVDKGVYPGCVIL